MNGSNHTKFNFTNTQQTPNQLFDEETETETKEIEETEAIKDYYNTIDNITTNVFQDILQEEKGYTEEQESALNDVIAKHTAEEIWKAKSPKEVWHQQLGHTIIELMVTITAIAAQVKPDAEKVAHDIAEVQSCMETTLPVVKRDLEQQEMCLCSHAQVLTIKEVSLAAQEKSIESKLDIY